jgi:hypothetical protein
MHSPLLHFSLAINSVLFRKLLVLSYGSVYQRLSLFNVCRSSKNHPSARFASAVDVVRRDVDVFGTVSLHRIL